MDIPLILTIVGILIALVIGAWQVYLAIKQIEITKQGQKNIASIQTTTAQHSEHRKQPYPKELISEIDKLPLAQQEQARRNYIGLKVEWQATLYSVTSKEGNIARLMMLDRGNYPWIHCEVDVSNYPELKIAREGHGLWVAGEIAEVGANSIKLVNCQIRLGEFTEKN